MTSLIKPYGGILQNLIIDSESAEQLKTESESYISITLNNRQLCDLEMLAIGAYSPLTDFMDQENYNSVVNKMKLVDGTLWPLPIVLDLPDQLAEQVYAGDKLALRDAEGFMLAVMTVQEKWSPDKQHEAKQVYGTTNLDHPGVNYLFNSTADNYISGELSVVQAPEHYVFSRFRRNPAEIRSFFEKQSWNRVLGYQTSNPIHKMHYEILVNAAKANQTHILIQPTVGSTKPGDTHYFHRVKCYESVLEKFPLKIARLSLMPHSMRMAGPRETLLHAIIHQNYGCTHFLVGPNHASPTNIQIEFYSPTAAQDVVANHQSSLDIEMVAVQEHQYQPSTKKFKTKRQIENEGEEGQKLTEQGFRELLRTGALVPEWYTYPEVIQELKKNYKPPSKQGFTLFFTGLSGSGKSTLAKIVYAKLVEHGTRPVTLLDGDVVRLNLSSELGFSKPHRDLNIRRIGFVANEISKNGGVAICAPIAPYANGRRAVRELIEQHGAFIEIHVSTPLEVCEARDRKGLYAKARKGIIPEFTGISDPYEVPEDPEIIINTAGTEPAAGAKKVLLHLFQRGYLDDV